MNVDVRQFPDPASLTKTAAADWVAWLRAAQGRRKGQERIRVALSGGRISRDFFAEAARQSTEGALYEQVHFFWADERCVPPSDAESNYALAKKFLLDPLKIPDAQVHRLRGEADEATALREAIAAITEGTPMSKGQPVLDLIHLGMGENGHTASLFPEEPADMVGDPAVYRAVTATKPPPRRLTLGYGAIAAAREAWVLVSGKGKEEAWKQTMVDGGDTPLARVLRMRAGTRIYTDILAQ